MDMFQTIIIFKPTKKIEEVNRLAEIIQDLNKTKQIKIENMGVKKLAYTIKRHTQGHFVIFTYKCHASQIQALDGLLRINSCVLKFLTVKNNSLPELKNRRTDVNKIYIHNLKPDGLDVLLGLADYT